MTHPPKTIRDSLTGELVDVTDVINLIDTPQFQRLARIKQLSCSDQVFRGANHTRFEHCIGVFKRTRGYRRQFGLDCELDVAGLLHDVMHPAFSHVGETAMRFYDPDYDHDRDLRHLDSLEGQISKSFDFSKVKAIFERRNPIHRIIWDRLGADKQDYITRDLHYCGYPVTETSGFLQYADYEPGKGLVFDISMCGPVKDFISDWWRAHQEIYFRKKTLLLRDELLRAIYYGLETEQLKREELLDSWDSNVESVLLRAELPGPDGAPSPKYFIDDIIQRRGSYSTVLTLKNERRGNQERKAKKSIYVKELPEGEIASFQKRITGSKVIEVERELGAELGYDVMISQMHNIRRLNTIDVTLDPQNGGSYTTLMTEFPKFGEGLEEEAHAFYAIRVAVPYAKRNDAYEKTAKVLGTLGLR